MPVAQQPNTQHVDTPPLSAAQAEANAVAKEVSERDAAIAAAHAEFQKDVQAANEKRLKVLAQYPDISIAGIAAQAWNNVRGADPVFNETILSHREKLLTHAEAVQRTGVPAENPSDFEIEVGRLLGELKAKRPAAIDLSQGSSGQAMVDAINLHDAGLGVNTNRRVADVPIDHPDRRSTV